MSMHVVERRSTSASWAYLRGMENWTGAVHVLLAHAVDAVEGPSIRSRLIGARDDAESLRDLLHTATRREDPNPTATATIESICSLWDANQHYFEQLAADADPAFYGLWMERTALTRAGRHGPPAGATT
jgi:hypothetical protein